MDWSYLNYHTLLENVTKSKDVDEESDKSLDTKPGWICQHVEGSYRQVCVKFKDF